MKKIIIILLFAVKAIASDAQLNTEHLMRVASNALYFEDYVLAIQYFNKIIQAKPYLEQPYLHRAIAKLNLEDYTGALKDLDTVIKRNEFLPMAFYARGYVLNRMNLYNKAENDLNKALDLNPDNTSYIIARLESYDRQKKYTEEERDLDYLIKKKSTAQLFLEKSRLLTIMGDTLKAFALTDSLVKTDSLNFNVWGGRAIINILLKKNEDALFDYNKAIDLQSDNPAHFTNRGILFYQKRDYRKALLDYNKAIEIEPNNTQTLYNRAILLSETADYHKAMIDLDKLIELNPDMDEAVYQRAMVAQRLGNLKDAIKDFSNIIDKYPDFSPAYYLRAQANETLGNKQLAYKDMSKVFEIEQNIGKKNTQKKENKPESDVKLANDRNSINRLAKIFDTTQNGDDEKSSNMNGSRGLVQNRNTKVGIMGDFVLSPYKKENRFDKLIHFSTHLNSFNRENKNSIFLYFTDDEIPLTDALINYHFKNIDEISEQIEKNKKDPDLYLIRGINYFLVKDFDLAIEDFTKSIDIQPSMLAYFCRAEINKKILEIQILQNTDIDGTTENSSEVSNLVKEKIQSELYNSILEDYNRSIQISGDLIFAWYNLGNMFCMLGNYSIAIERYSQAIKINPNFAQAYFNRGLAHIYTNAIDKGKSDLSKAGELGIYQAYSIIKKLNK